MGGGIDTGRREEWAYKYWGEREGEHNKKKMVNGGLERRREDLKQGREILTRARQNQSEILIK